MLKITQVVYKYPPFYSGYGKQLSLLNNCLSNKNKNIDLTIITGFKSSNQTQTNNVKIVSFPYLDFFRCSKVLHFYLFTLSTFFQLLFLPREHKILHCIKAGPEAVVTIIVSMMTNRVAIVKVAQNEIRECLESNNNLFKQIFRNIRLSILKKADYIIAISNQIEQELLNAQFSPEQIIKIPNGVDIEKFKPLKSLEEKYRLRQELNISKNEFVGIFVGSITVRKGIFDLLQALKYFSSSISITILIVGPDYSKGELEKIMIDPKVNLKLIGDNITVKYYGEQRDINKMYCLSDFLILPSYSEGQPNVVMEALSSGLPVIGTNIGGIRDLVTNNYNGYLINTGNLQEIAEAMEKMACNFAQLSLNAPESVKEYAMEKIANKYYQLYFKNETKTKKS